MTPPSHAYSRNAAELLGSGESDLNPLAKLRGETFVELLAKPATVADSLTTWTTLVVVNAITVRQLGLSPSAGTFSSSVQTIVSVSVVYMEVNRP